MKNNEYREMEQALDKGMNQGNGVRSRKIMKRDKNGR